MPIKRGDTVVFNYIPQHMKLEDLPSKGHLSGRSIVLKVLRQNNSVLVRVWNGKILCPVSEQYDEIEISMDSVNKV